MTTTDTYVKTKPENLKGLQFTHPLGAACIQTVYQLKKEGQIDMIILLMHIGTDMKMPYRITEENAQGLPFIDKVDAIISPTRMSWCSIKSITSPSSKPA